MRPVALAVALAILSVLPAATPSTSSDECANAGVPSCITVAPGQAGAPTTQIVYVYAASATCAPQFNTVCAGRPTSGAPVGLMGLVYQESNTREGLQRFKTVTGSGEFPPDRALLL